MSTIQKPLTKMVEFEQRDVLLKDIEILPDLHQTRAKTDMRVVNVYSRAIADGSVFPPVVVFRATDERMILADGFHRVEARRRLGLKNVRAVIRDGTPEDAVLFGIEANFNPDNIREVTKDDRQHAVATMIRNATFRTWSDSEIASRCGVAGQTVRLIRMRLAESENVPIPRRILAFANGKPTGQTFAYRRKPAPRTCGTGRSGLVVRFDGESHYISADGCNEAASKMHADLLAEVERRRDCLADNRRFRRWLSTRLVSSDVADACLGGILVSGVVLVPVPDVAYDAVLKALGVLFLLRRGTPGARGVLVVSRRVGSSAVGKAMQAAREAGVELLTPEELVASLKGEAGDPQP